MCSDSIPIKCYPLFNICPSQNLTSPAKHKPRASERSIRIQLDPIAPPVNPHTSALKQISSMVHLQYISYFTSCALRGRNYTYCYSYRKMLVNSLDSWDAFEIGVCAFNEGKPKVTITQVCLKVTIYQHQHKRDAISLKVTLLSLVHILFCAYKPNSLDTWFLRYFLNTSWRLTKATLFVDLDRVLTFLHPMFCSPCTQT